MRRRVPAASAACAVRTARATRAACAVLAAVAALALTAVLPGAGARADVPLPLTRTGDRLTDRANALGPRAAQVRSALKRLYETHHVRLFVAYVNDFTAHTPQDWANATATGNGLGRHDLLLAVATPRPPYERGAQYAVSAAQDSGLTPSQLGEVSSTAVEPALRRGDWAGAAIAAAYGYEAVLSGRPVVPLAGAPGTVQPAGPAADRNGAADLWIPVVAVAAAGLVGLYAHARRSRRTDEPLRRPAPGRTRGWRAPQPTPLPELANQARDLLVATDDAVRTSQEEVEWAATQCGQAAARPFEEAVGYARGELAAAFRLRQRLDAAFPENDATHRQMLDEILSRCTQANRRLDAESEAFDRLRALEASAPDVLTQAEAVAAALPDRIAAAEGALRELAGTYTDTAVEPVAGFPAEARERLDVARSGLERARAAVGTDRRRAAAFLRAAEVALSQARTLADAVTRRAHELRAADDRLGEGPTPAAEESRTPGRARGGATPAGGGRRDPVAALRAQGEQASEAGRELEHDLLDQALLIARIEVAAARDVVTTHRGAIGAPARTRLAESERRLALALSDPPTALAHARAADRLARQAQETARQNLAAHARGGGPSATGFAFGGPQTRRRFTTAL